jgi:hypothetical protein
MDRCEPFDTYPRTYDLLHAFGLFSKEQIRYSSSEYEIHIYLSVQLAPKTSVEISMPFNLRNPIMQLGTNR